MVEVEVRDLVLVGVELEHLVVGDELMVVHRLHIVVVLRVLVPRVLLQDMLPLVNRLMHYKWNSVAGQ